MTHLVQYLVYSWNETMVIMRNPFTSMIQIEMMVNTSKPNG